MHTRGALACTAAINLIHLYFIIISRAQYRRLTTPVVKLARIARGAGFTCRDKLARKTSIWHHTFAGESDVSIVSPEFMPSREQLRRKFSPSRRWIGFYPRDRVFSLVSFSCRDNKRHDYSNVSAEIPLLNIVLRVHTLHLIFTFSVEYRHLCAITENDVKWWNNSSYSSLLASSNRYQFLQNSNNRIFFWNVSKRREFYGKSYYRIL